MTTGPTTAAALYSARSRQKRIDERGACYDCSAPANTGAKRCERHRLHHNAKERARKAALRSTSATTKGEP